MSCSVRNPTSTDPYSSMIPVTYSPAARPSPSTSRRVRAPAATPSLQRRHPTVPMRSVPSAIWFGGLPAVALAVEYTADVSVMFVRYHTLTNPSVSP